MLKFLIDAAGLTLPAALSRSDFIATFNLSMFILLTLCYGYQLFYVVIAFRQKSMHPPAAARMHRFAVLIAARNEQATIGNLLHSLEEQDYPKELVDVFVIADNCTDHTASIARAHGATVFERHNTKLLGKGYALDFGYQRIRRDARLSDAYDAFLVFDADNLLDPGFVAAMNRTLAQGAEISTSFRNSKNYADNWISAGYGLWFLREARFLSQARKALNTTCAISGTGFYVSARILASTGGWKWHLLTEDIEFSVDAAIKCRRIAYTPDAILYDEQRLRLQLRGTNASVGQRGFTRSLVHMGSTCSRVSSERRKAHGSVATTCSSPLLPDSCSRCSSVPATSLPSWRLSMEAALRRSYSSHSSLRYRVLRTTLWSCLRLAR